MGRALGWCRFSTYDIGSRVRLGLDPVSGSIIRVSVGFPLILQRFLDGFAELFGVIQFYTWFSDLVLGSFERSRELGQRSTLQSVGSIGFQEGVLI